MKNSEANLQQSGIKNMVFCVWIIVWQNPCKPCTRFPNVARPHGVETSSERLKQGVEQFALRLVPADRPLSTPNNKPLVDEWGAPFEKDGSFSFGGTTSIDSPISYLCISHVSHLGAGFPASFLVSYGWGALNQGRNLRIDPWPTESKSDARHAGHSELRTHHRRLRPHLRQCGRHRGRAAGICVSPRDVRGCSVVHLSGPRLMSM